MLISFNGYAPPHVPEQSPELQQYRKFMALRPGDQRFANANGKFVSAEITEYPRLTRAGAMVQTKEHGILPQHMVFA
jgi:hypothetical protein